MSQTRHFGGRWQSRSERGTRRGGAYLFLTPWMAGLVLITLGPLLASLYLSFTDYNLLSDPSWVGLENYRRMFFDDPRFYKALGVTFTYVLVSVPLQLILALMLAIVLNAGVRGLALYRSAYYLPSLIGGSVAVAILWRQVFGAEGVINAVLGAFGAENLPNWISNPQTALGTLIVLNVWTFGSPMIIFLAGLRQIPTELYEQGSIDGVGRIGRLRYITLPLLTPIIFFNLVLQIIGAFQAFTPAFVVSGGTGGPVDSTLFYTLYLYERGFINFEMGYASALGAVLLVLIGVLTAINFYASKRWVHYND
ncbi:carbohydrate ABC transporter permease [Arthrobacter sp. MPF02]|uniref:carbohydrate ABC transporter permease n=1 Tax=Arthrobacter sp. MPF02 TaxID=3388492 RepID=UPI003984C8D0